MFDQPARAVPCPCGHASCSAWFVEPYAAMQGVRFTQKEAEIIALFINTMHAAPDRQGPVPARHGTPYDRGDSDAHYGRRPRPHKWEVGDPLGRVEVLDLTEAEVADYHRGYDENPSGRKEW